MMNKNTPLGRRDPRTEVVDVKYLRLAADVLVNNQDFQYWKTVRVPKRPSDRLPFEELFQLAVFSPLAAVPLAFTTFGLAGAAVATAVALPVMALFNRFLKSAVTARGIATRKRDAGRYAFTKFMCSEFGLRPQDVTLGLVVKMGEDFKRWIADAQSANQVRDRFVELLRTETAPAPAAATTVSGRNTYMPAVPATTGTAATSTATGMALNPATGLPLIAGMMVDVQGNPVGMSNTDELFSPSTHADLAESFNAPAPDFGYDPGMGNGGDMFQQQ